jgi:hypothetical protein
MSKAIRHPDGVTDALDSRIGSMMQMRTAKRAWGCDEAGDKSPNLEIQKWR